MFAPLESHRRALLLGVAGVFALTAAAGAQTAAIQSGEVRAYSTIYSIGLEWNVAGDANHNGTAAVEYRVAGVQAPWSAALPLVRIDYNGANQLAGSILFLVPGTTYDVRLSLTDPDGGGDVRTVAVRTRPLPELSTGGRTFHVIASRQSGGSGSPGDPFKGIAAAQAIARPGDVFLLHGGSYGGRVRFDVPGEPGSYVAWKAAGDGEVTLRGIDIAASHVWLEGLTVRNQSYATFSIGAPEDVVVTRCGFYGNHYSVYLQQGGEGWYIADNTIVGDTAATTESFDGEGIELNTTAGHTVAHNSITNVADGISYPLRNVDMFGNDIFDTSDDGIEGDYGYGNVRMWGNRIQNAVHNGISFQPQYGGPWYIIRNQIVSNKESPLKFRTTDRFVLLHNTIVNWGSINCCNGDHLLRAIARNNLWISTQGGEVWDFGAAVADWRSDLDYDGADWGAAGTPFIYGGLPYSDIPLLAKASGLETHGRRIAHTACFETLDLPGPSPTTVPPQVLLLSPGCEAVDAGIQLPNIDGEFLGSAPDLGAFELGQAPPVFGPRLPVSAESLQAPTDLVARAVSPTRVDLVWTDTAGAENGFSLERSSGGVPFFEVASLTANASAWTDTSVQPNTRYSYRVRAWNDVGASAFSNTATVKTPKR